MASTGLFSQFGLPEQDAQALIRLRKEKDKQGFLEQVQAGQSAQPQAMQQAYRGGAFLGRGVNEQFGEPVGLTEGELADFELQEKMAEATQRVTQDEEFGTLTPQQQQIATLGAAEKAAQAAGRSDIAAQIAKQRLDLTRASQETETFGQKILRMQEDAARYEAGGNTRAAELLRSRMSDLAGEQLGSKNLSQTERIINELYPDPDDPRRREALVQALDGKERLTDFQRKIKTAQEIYGEEKGMKIATGAAEVTRDPITGKTTYVDLSTGKTEVIKGTDVGTTELPSYASNLDIAQGESLYELADIVTGPQNYIKRGLEFAGALVSEDVDTRRAAAAQSWNTRGQLVVRALSNNPRFPVAEQQRILEQLTVKPGFFKDPQIAKSQMNALDKDLRTFLNAERSTAENTRLPDGMREDAMKSARNIQTFLSTLLPQVEPELREEEGLPDGTVYTGETDVEGRPIIRLPNGIDGVIK